MFHFQGNVNECFVVQMLDDVTQHKSTAIPNNYLTNKPATRRYIFIYSQRSVYKHTQRIRKPRNDLCNLRSVKYI